MPPMVFVPGYGMGALQVEVRRDQEIRATFDFLLPGMNPESILPPPARTALEYSVSSGLSPDDQGEVSSWLKLETLEDGRVRSKPGVTVEPVSIGKNFAAECPRYATMAERMQGEGWFADENLFCLPFDYRFPPQATGFAANLRNLIESVVRDSASGQVVLACHSQGCLFSYYALRTMDPDWLQEHVLLFFSFAGQFSGCSDCMRWAFQEDWSWDPNNALVSVSDRTWAGELALGLQSSVYRDQVLYRNGEAEYRAGDVGRLLNDTGALSMERATRRYALDAQDWFRLGDVERTELVVESRFLYGTKIPTTVGFTYPSIPPRAPDCVDPTCAGFMEEDYPGEIRADGDGGDSTWMNEAPQRWTKNPACDMRAFPGVPHMEIFENPEALGLLGGAVRALLAGAPACLAQ